MNSRSISKSNQVIWRCNSGTVVLVATDEDAGIVTDFKVLTQIGTSLLSYLASQLIINWVTYCDTFTAIKKLDSQMKHPLAQYEERFSQWYGPTFFKKRPLNLFGSLAKSNCCIWLLDSEEYITRISGTKATWAHGVFVTKADFSSGVYMHFDKQQVCFMIVSSAKPEKLTDNSSENCPI